MFSGLFYVVPNRAGEGLCSYDAFHFSRIEQDNSLPNVMARHQHIVFSLFSLRSQKTVLAVACGSGTVSRYSVQSTNVNIVGIDTDSRLVRSLHHHPGVLITSI